MSMDGCTNNCLFINESNSHSLLAVQIVIKAAMKRTYTNAFPSYMLLDPFKNLKIVFMNTISAAENRTNVFVSVPFLELQKPGGEIFGK